MTDVLLLYGRSAIRDMAFVFMQNFCFSVSLRGHDRDTAGLVNVVAYRGVATGWTGVDMLFWMHRPRTVMSR